MVITIIGLTVLGIATIYGFVKAVNAIFNPWIRRLEKRDNPYIAMHRIKFHNDKMYDEYLKWLDKNGGDIPFEKWKTEEEVRFEKELNR